MAEELANIWVMADLATPMSVRIAATLGIPDHLAAGRRTAAEIADACGVHADSLDRVMRHLVTVGLLEWDGEGYTATPSGEQLRDDHPAGGRKWLDSNGAIGRADLSFVELPHTVRTGEPAYPARYGTDFWADLAADETLSTSFDALMNLRIDIDSTGVTGSYDWSGLEHVVDVGGGNGNLLSLLLAANPGLRGTVVDLPGPADNARTLLRDKGLADRAEAVAGSFFDPLPAGAGAYVLSAVLHDWDDKSATEILRRCAEAAGTDGVVLVIESVGADGQTPPTAMDLRMLAYTSGRERTLAQYGAIAEAAGLAVTGLFPVDPTSIIELRAA